MEITDEKVFLKFLGPKPRRVDGYLNENDPLPVDYYFKPGETYPLRRDHAEWLISKCPGEFCLIKESENELSKKDDHFKNISEVENKRRIPNALYEEDLVNYSDEGWIKLYRKIEHSPVFQNPGLLKVWIWCLVRANHQDQWVSVKTGRGKTEILVKRGQFIFGRNSAAKALNMPAKTVHYQMLKLESMQNLAIQKDSHFSIVTIRNYDDYQSNKNIGLPGKLPGNCQATATNKNDKNYKKNNNILFDSENQTDSFPSKNLEKRKKQNNKPTDPRIEQFFVFWAQEFEDQTGQKYVFSFGKEGRLIKDLLAVHPLETLIEAAKYYFKDERCRNRGFTIGFFYQEINRILSLKSMDPLAQAKRERIKRKNGQKGV